MSMLLNLLTAPSATYGSCEPMGTSPYSINPTFQLSALPFGDSENGLANGQGTTVSGLIAAVDGSANNLTVNSPDGSTWTVSTQGSPVYRRS